MKAHDLQLSPGARVEYAGIGLTGATRSHWGLSVQLLLARFGGLRASGRLRYGDDSGPEILDRVRSPLRSNRSHHRPVRQLEVAGRGT